MLSVLGTLQAYRPYNCFALRFDSSALARILFQTKVRIATPAGAHPSRWGRRGWGEILIAKIVRSRAFLVKNGLLQMCKIYCAGN